MTQTTTSVGMADGTLWVSTDGSAFTDISGVAVSLASTEQTRISGEAYTLDGDTSIIGTGKREPVELEIVYIYTETDAEGHELTRDVFMTPGGGDFYMRWAPKGDTAGNEQLTTTKGKITAFKHPELDAGSGDVSLTGFKVKVPEILSTIISS